mmetsp:Transcript_75631/g.210096  ORF Transcript_75631/g.210096 Transcript_75631/m.210096 type:complete len:107 (-) Transcript_75631:48-368(-)
MELLGHDASRTIDLLKIDCEGCELSTLRDWTHLDIRQILIEVHGVPSPRGTPKARWYEANGFSGILQGFLGQWIRAVLEGSSDGPVHGTFLHQTSRGLSGRMKREL